jgi:hypothetical protein
VHDTPAPLADTQPVAKHEEERPVAHERPAAGALVTLAVEASETTGLAATAGAFHPDSGVREGGHPEKCTPPGMPVPRGNRSFQRRN